MQILAVRFQNCFSFGNEMTEVRFTGASPALVVGKNGAGKSSGVLDTLVYGLYGKPYRKVKLGQMINSITGRDLVVEVDLVVKGKQYKIRRGQKPALFEVYRDGVLVDQAASSRDQQEWLEKSVLQMDYRSFVQIVILGSANHVPFMQLPAAQRREVIEDILDIQVFSTMNEVLKERVSELKERLVGQEKDLAVAVRELEVETRHVQASQADTADEMGYLIAQKLALEITNATLIETIVRLTTDAQALTESISDAEKVRIKKQQLEKVRTQLEDKADRLRQMIDFFVKHENCPTCRQAIDPAIAKQEMDDKEKELEQVVEGIALAGSNLEQVTTRLEEISGVQASITEIDRDFVKKKTELGATERQVVELEARIRSSRDQQRGDQLRLQELQVLVTELSRARDESLGQAKLFNWASTLLKDQGIKAQIVRQYIPEMNRRVNKYLAALELFVDFHLDENFNEQIRSRHRDAFSYESFSEGEKLRIDLAILFAWRDIARMRNSSSTDLIIFDEILDGSLDAEGADYFLNLVRSLTSECNVFVISHKEGIEDKFSRTLTFDKRQNFSKLHEK